MKGRNTKVLQVIGGSEFGGAVWIILSYVQMLQAQGFEVLVCASADSVAQAYKEIGCEIVAVDEMRRSINPFLDSKAFYKLWQLCRHREIDIVHTHTSKGGFLGRAAGRFAHVPIVIHTVHGFAFHEGSSPLSIRAFAAIERLAARWCDKITTVSEFHRRWAIQLGIVPPDKICTVHNGISTDRLIPNRRRADVRQDFGLEEDSFLIATVGRLAPQKGLEYLLQATGAVRTEVPKVKLVIAGDGPSGASLRELTRRLGLDNVVMFTGFSSDVGTLLHACDVLVSPTLREGMSVSILEAMALGKPVITTNISSNKELITDGLSGMLVPPRDENMLARKIINLATDEDLQKKFGLAAAERFQLYFSEKKMQDDLWEVYHQLIRDKLPRSKYH